ncbi:zinc finger, CCHC-type containing protein [Tanacetum coccineum]
MLHMRFMQSAEATNGNSLIECEGDIIIPCRLATVASGAASATWMARQRPDDIVLVIDFTIVGVQTTTYMSNNIPSVTGNHHIFHQPPNASDFCGRQISTLSSLLCSLIDSDPVQEKQNSTAASSKSSAGEASTAAAAPKCCLSNVLVLKEVSHYCLGTRMICAASVYFMLLMQDLMLPVVISYVNAAIDTTAIGFKKKKSWLHFTLTACTLGLGPGCIFTLIAIAKWECSSYGRALALHARGTGHVDEIYVDLYVALSIPAWVAAISNGYREDNAWNVYASVSVTSCDIGDVKPNLKVRYMSIFATSYFGGLKSSMLGHRDEHGSGTGGIGSETDRSENQNFKKSRNRELKQKYISVLVLVPVLVPVLCLRIVLSVEDKLTYLEHPIPATPIPAPGQQIHRIALNMEHLGAYDMLKGLKTLFYQQAERELLQIVREFHACKQEGQSVSSYVLKMKSYIDNLEHLGHPMSLSLAVSLILVSLSEEYDSFVQNYNMHDMRKTVNELHDMLKLHEQTLPNKDVAHALFAIRVGKVQKKIHKNKKPHMATKGNNRKGTTKLAYVPAYAHTYAPKPKSSPPPKKDNPAKDAICRQCSDVGHWIKNCPQYLTELMKKNKLFQRASTSGTKGEYKAKAMSFEPHCRLGHISKKRIEKLQHDGLLNSTDTESFGSCVSCMSGKMARKLIHIKWKGLNIYLD